MTDKLEFARRVARGVEWLDQTQPEWRDRVDIEKFDIRYGDRCILGQVFAPEAENDWDEYLSDGFSWAQDNLLEDLDPGDFGFDLDNMSGYYGSPEYAVLQDMWLAELGEEDE